jgi:hypothetical protein
MTESFHLRIASIEQKYIDYIKANTLSCLVVQENADEDINRDHMHAQIMINIQMKSWRNKFKEAFPDLKGNSDYSLTLVRDTMKMDYYICKGKDVASPPCIRYRHGIRYTEEYIKSCHDQYWIINKEVKKKEKMDKLGIRDEVVKLCKDHGTSWSDRDTITEYFLLVMKKYGKDIDIFRARARIQGIQLELCANEDYKRYFVDKIWY